MYELATSNRPPKTFHSTPSDCGTNRKKTQGGLLRVMASNGTPTRTNGVHVDGAHQAEPEVKMPQLPEPPSFQDKHQERKYLKQRLAAAIRILGTRGYEEGVAGHLTVRDPIDSNTFWVNPYGTSFALIKASDLIRIDRNGSVLEGGQNRLLNPAAYLVHGAIHIARPDVLAICHSHTIHGRAFCALGKSLDMINQDACAFYLDQALYNEYGSSLREEGKAIASTLQDKKVILMQNHGILTTGSTIEEAVFWFVSLDRCCQTQLLADAAAGARAMDTRKIKPEECAVMHKIFGSQKAGYFAAQPMFDAIQAVTSGSYMD